MKLTSSCSIVTFNYDTRLCQIHRYFAIKSPIYKESKIDILINNNYVKQFSDLPSIGLTNYWSFNNHVNDLIGGANMTGGSSKGKSFVKDKYGIDSAALYLNDGFYNLPNGVYISGDFTLSVWIKLISSNDYARLLSINNINNITNGFTDSVQFTIGSSLSKQINPYINFTHINGSSWRIQSTKGLTMNKWQHLVFRLNGTDLNIIIDGELTEKCPTPMIPNAVIRNNVQFGALNGYGNQRPDAYMDELRLYNRSLSYDEIMSFTL